MKKKLDSIKTTLMPGIAWQIWPYINARQAHARRATANFVQNYLAVRRNTWHLGALPLPHSSMHRSPKHPIRLFSFDGISCLHRINLKIHEILKKHIFNKSD